MEKKLPSRIKRKRNIKIKKSTVGIFVAIFAFVFAMFQAFAGENPRVTISNSNTPNSKGQYTLTVDLETNKEYSGLVLGIEYDPDELEFVRATANDIWRPYTAAEQAQIDALADEGLSPAELSAEVANLNKEFGLDWQTIVNTETPGQILLTYLFLDDRTANADNNLAKLVFKPKAGAAGKLDVTISNARMEYIGDDESIEYVVDTVDGYVQVDVPVESYELEEDTFELQKGATEQLNVVYTPENTTADKTFTYSSSDSNIVSVDDNGLMTANAVGTATITVHAFGDTLTANVTVRTSGVKEVIEVTIPIKRAILRAEERNDDIYASIDLVSDKLERQIRKNKTKIKHNKANRETIDVFIDFETTPKDDEEGTIIKRKTIDHKPMGEEEAILQMELSGHDFFMFKSVETDNVAVVYKRKDGGYGIIESE